MTGMETVRVGVGPVSFEDLVAVAREGAAVAVTDESLTAVDRARAFVEELAAAPVPAYGVSTGFGALATRYIPTELRAQLQRVADPLARRRVGPRGRARGGARPDAAAPLDAGDGPHRRARATAQLLAALLNAGITRWSGSTARSAARVTWPRWLTAPWR